MSHLSASSRYKEHSPYDTATGIKPDLGTDRPAPAIIQLILRFLIASSGELIAVGFLLIYAIQRVSVWYAKCFFHLTIWNILERPATHLQLVTEK